MTQLCSKSLWQLVLFVLVLIFMGGDWCLFICLICVGFFYNLYFIYLFIYFYLFALHPTHCPPPSHPSHSSSSTSPLSRWGPPLVSLSAIVLKEQLKQARLVLWEILKNPALVLATLPLRPGRPCTGRQGPTCSYLMESLT